MAKSKIKSTTQPTVAAKTRNKDNTPEPQLRPIFPNLEKMEVSAANWANLQGNYKAATTEVKRLEQSQNDNEQVIRHFQASNLALEAEVASLKAGALATSEATPDTVMIDGISVKRLVRHLDGKARYSLRTISRMLGIQQNFTNAIAVARAAYEARKEDAMDDFVGAWAETDPKFTEQPQ